MHPDVEKLLATYRDKVQPQMCGLPMYNANLQTEAIGFEWREGRLSGVLLTPWFMNLVLLPNESDEWLKLPPGKTFEVDFPSGSQRCMLSAPEGIVPHLSLPLFTTVQDFTDQDGARRVAEEVLRQLYFDAVNTDATEISQDPMRSRQTMSRRDLLRF